MKKVVLNYLVIAALAGAAAFTSCGGGSGSSKSGGGKSTAKIKMTTEEDGELSFLLTGSGVATVDWGDGSEKVSLTLKEGDPNYGVKFKHTYPNATIRTVTINGDNITGLCCEDLTSLDVSRCTELTDLSCRGALSSLDVSKNKAMTSFYVCNVPLTSLDVSKNTALTSLYVFNVPLTSLDVSKNTELSSLGIRGTQLTSLDVSKNKAMTYLEINWLPEEALNALFETLHSNDVGEKKQMFTRGNGDRSIAERKGWTVNTSF